MLNYHHRLQDTHEMPNWVGDLNKDLSGSCLSFSLIWCFISEWSKTVWVSDLFMRPKIGIICYSGWWLGTMNIREHQSILKHWNIFISFSPFSGSSPVSPVDTLDPLHVPPRRWDNFQADDDDTKVKSEIMITTWQGFKKVELFRKWIKRKFSQSLFLRTSWT